MYKYHCCIVHIVLFATNVKGKKASQFSNVVRKKARDVTFNPFGQATIQNGSCDKM